AEGLAVKGWELLLEQVQISGQQFFLPVWLQVHVGVNEEGRQVIAQGSETPTLEIDDPDTGVLDHQVAGLEVPVQEEVGGRSEGPGEEALKVRSQIVHFQLQARVALQKSPDEIAAFPFPQERPVH